VILEKVINRKGREGNQRTRFVIKIIDSVITVAFGLGSISFASFASFAVQELDLE